GGGRGGGRDALKGRWHPASVAHAPAPSCNAERAENAQTGARAKARASGPLRSSRSLRSWRLPQARQDRFRALAELLVGRDLPGVLLRLAPARQVQAGDGGVEVRRRHLTPPLGDVLLAAAGLPR